MSITEADREALEDEFFRDNYSRELPQAARVAAMLLADSYEDAGDIEMAAAWRHAAESGGRPERYSEKQYIFYRREYWEGVFGTDILTAHDIPDAVFSSLGGSRTAGGRNSLIYDTACAALLALWRASDGV